MEIWLIFALLGIGFLAITAELFLPAGGLIGILGFGGMVVAIVFAFKDHGSTLGFLALAITLVGTPVLITIGFSLFPKTIVGKKLILQDSQKQQSGYTSYSQDLYQHLAGSEGITVTALRPSGMARINDKKYSVVCQAGFIEPGTKVKVTKVEGSRIVVRKA